LIATSATAFGASSTGAPSGGIGQASTPPHFLDPAIWSAPPRARRFSDPTAPRRKGNTFREEATDDRAHFNAVAYKAVLTALKDGLLVLPAKRIATGDYLAHLDE
jgi:hypothetical protein